MNFVAITWQNLIFFRFIVGRHSSVSTVCCHTTLVERCQLWPVAFSITVWNARLFVCLLLAYFGQNLSSFLVCFSDIENVIVANAANCWSLSHEFVFAQMPGVWFCTHTLTVYVANDVGQGCYGAMKVRDAFANAYRELRDAVLPQYQHIQSQCSSFLGRILLVPVEVVKYRRVIEKCWQLRPCSTSSSLSSAAEDTANSCEHPPAAAVGVGGVSSTQLADDKHVLLWFVSLTHTHTPWLLSAYHCPVGNLFTAASHNWHWHHLQCHNLHWQWHCLCMSMSMSIVDLYSA